MFLTRVLPFAAVLGSIACGPTTQTLRLDSTPRPVTTLDSIQVIGQEPKRPYTVIAIVSATALAAEGAEVARGKLVKLAARLGGHAVLLEANSLAWSSTGGEYGSTIVQLSGKVIVYTDTTRADSSRAH